MTASEAREKTIARVKLVEKPISKLQEIYDTIDRWVNREMWSSVFISTFDICEEDKIALEKDGYFIDTCYTTGFQVRWYEKDEQYFYAVLNRQKQYAKIKTSDDVINNYLKLQGFKQ